MRFLKFGFVALLISFSSAVMAAAPDFSSLTAVSNNTNSDWAKEGDIITFTLNIDVAEDSNGGMITFDIGSLTGQTASFANTAASTSHVAFYTVPAGANGSISITGLTFQNSALENIINVPGMPFTPGTTVTVDTIAPVLASIRAVSNNADTTKAKSGDSISFTLTLTTADTWNNGNTLNYSIGGGASTALSSAFNSTSGTTTKLSGSRSITVPATDDGTLNIDNLTFTDRAGNVITGFAAGAPVPNVTVDVTNPAIAFTDNVGAGPVQSDTIILTVTETDPNTTSFKYGFSADNVCDGTDTFGNAFTSGVGFVLNTEANNGNYVCAKAEDGSGNITYASSAFPLNIDVTPPSVTGTVQVSSNANAGFAKAGDTITYTISYNESVTVGPVNVASSGNNATGAVTEVGAVNTNIDTLVLTVQAGDNGVVTPNVNFDVTDKVGNTATITSLAPITGGSGANTITADTMIPSINSVVIASNNANSPMWAKTGDTITLSFTGSEPLSNVSGTLLTEAATTNNSAGNDWTASLLTDGNEAEGLVPFVINFSDLAGNMGMPVNATTNGSSVTFDKTAPTVTPVSIISNNALNTALAKSNDTITVNFTVADNLSTAASISGAPTILGNPAVPSAIVIGAGSSISRLTDGTETSEVVAPFSFAVQDTAGNVTANITATTDASQVQFDRTEPVIRSVKVSSTSADNSADLRDVPTYYAKQGDELRLSLDICDYVDSNNNPPTGTFFGQAVTLTDQGLVGAPGNCTTGAGNPSQWRNWRVLLPNVDGTEGLVTFSIDPKDNAGNVLVPAVTVTTDGSSIIFDKTNPLPPTDMVDLGGAEAPGYKPSGNADLYTWTNDSDPMGGTVASGVYQFDIRYNNMNTNINEIVTITEPTRNFAPAMMIPDIDPYTVNMAVRDKAGNTATETVVYTQRYGVQISGKVVDNQTGNPIPGTIVNAIAAFGSDCNLPGQGVCGDETDQNGDYVVTVVPNATYKFDATQTPNYYIAKDDITVTVNDVISNIRLEPVAEDQVQTGNQGTVITTDLEFSLNGVPQTTYITIFSESGEINTTQSFEGITITSFGTITSVTSNNPDVEIVDQGNNTYLIKSAGNILNTSDNQNRGSSVSSTFVSGSNQVGARRATGGANAGFQVGINREDRVVNGKAWTYAESMAFAQKLNQGADFKVMQYRNRNGFMVFAGYRHGRLAMADMAGSNPNLKLNKQIVYRGPRRGTENAFRNIAVEDRKEIVNTLFEQEENSGEPETLVVEEGNQQKAARARVETKKTAFTYDNPEISGFGRPESVYPGVYNKRDNDDRYINKFARVNPPKDVTPSRIQGKNVDIIVFRKGGSRSGKKLALGQLFNENPQLLTKRERVVRR